MTIMSVKMVEKIQENLLLIFGLSSLRNEATFYSDSEPEERKEAGNKIHLPLCKKGLKFNMNWNERVEKRRSVL